MGKGNGRGRGSGVSRRIAVLLVDDEPCWHRTVRRMLSGPEFDLTCVASHDAALVLAESRAFDAHLVDLELEPGPGGTPRRGLLTCAELVALRSEPPLFLFSASDDSGVRVAALSAGAKGCIRKHEVSTEELRLLLQVNVSPRPGALQLGPLRMDVDTGRFTLNERPLDLARMERAVLSVLLRESDRDVDLAFIAREAGCASTAAARKQVELLRRLLVVEAAALGDTAVVHVVNRRGVGYRLVVSERVAEPRSA